MSGRIGGKVSGKFLAGHVQEQLVLQRIAALGCLVLPLSGKGEGKQEGAFVAGKSEKAIAELEPVNEQGRFLNAGSRGFCRRTVEGGGRGIYQQADTGHPLNPAPQKSGYGPVQLQGAG